jgi:diguanylate cyclase (GGDEF)-like protein
VLENALERKSEHILCYLDLDQFKTVNDTVGHIAGDELLRQISTLWSKRLRQRDTLARLGGDEFAILLEHCPLDQGIAIANEFVKTTQDFHFEWEGKTFSIGVSIGVTAITAATKTTKQIMQLVDAACYAAKREGRNRIHVHYSGSEGKQPRNWVAYLDQALRDDRMQLFYQIIVPSVKEKHREHYQILLRMQNTDEEEVVTTGMFLPAQERPGLAPVLDRWVIRQVLHWLISKSEYLLRAQVWAFNMSRYTLEDKAFPVFLKRQLEHYGVPATKLCLVFSESTLISHIDGAQRLLNALKGIGCYVAVDDFASAPSGFSYLRRLPVDFLKIDGRVIKNAVNDPIAFAIVKSTNEIAHMIGIQTIAKSVDDTVIANKVRPLRIDYWQGYYVAKPVRFED